MNGPGRAVGREGALYLAATIIQRGLPVAILPVLSRVVPVADIGAMAASLALANLISIVLSLGLQFSVVRLVHDRPERSERPNWPGLIWIQLMAAVLLGAAILLTGRWWSPLFFAEIGWSPVAGWGVALGVALSVQGLLLSLARTTLRISAFMAMTILQAIVGQLAGVALSFIWGATGYIAGMAVGAALAAATGFWRLRVPRQLKVRQGRMIVTFSAWFIAHYLASWALNMSDRPLVQWFLGVDVLSGYYLAYVVGTGLLMVLDAAQSAWVPRFFSSGDRSAKSSILERALIPASVITTGATLSIALAMPVLLRIVSPNLPAWATTVGVVVSLTAVVRPPYLLAVAVLNDHKDSRRMAVASFVSAGVSIGLNLIMLPTVGIAGAAITTVIAYGVQTVWCLAGTRGLAPLSRATVLRMIALWVAAVLATGGILLIPDGITWSVVRIVAAALIASATALWILRSARRRG